MAHYTNIRVLTMDNMSILITAPFCANIGLSSKIVLGVIGVCPSATTSKDLILDLTTDCILLNTKEIERKSLELMVDKVKDTSQSKSFVKLMS